MIRKIILLLAISFLALNATQDTLLGLDEQILRLQTRLLESEEFSSRGIQGKGIRIAILDGGFPGVDTHPGLSHLIKNGKIIATWDFIHNKENVFHGNPHGTAVLSCIAGVYGNAPVGLAPEAEILLALTEMSGEPKREEENWAHAVFWAIENGARIIQSSIGYTYHRYFQEELDGKTSISAHAAAEAARRGILIVNSCGNEGTTRWKTLDTPADADSIISVGAINPFSGLAEQYSSLGPTADGRLKPNVCAPGTVMALTADGGIRQMQGTSFAAPLITGFAACLMQLKPNASAQEILTLIEQSGHLYPYYDYSHGYGVPQASRLFHVSHDTATCGVVIGRVDGVFTIETAKTCLPNPNSLWSNYLYYQINRADGFIHHYGITTLHPYLQTTIPGLDLARGEAFRVWYNGIVTEWKGQ